MRLDAPFHRVNVTGTQTDLTRDVLRPVKTMSNGRPISA
jgi:hypothetical protein